MNLLHSIGTAVASVMAFLGLLVVVHPVSLPMPSLAATNAIETPVALFSTSLANGISSTATSMTLVSSLTKDSVTLASSTYSFIIDEGTASEEFVIADCLATACSNMQRGLSVITGTTTVATLQYSHRRGASVKITDAPVLVKTVRIINGIGNFPNPIRYDSSIATSTIAANRSNIASVGLLQDTAFNGAGIISATQTAKGVVELATQLETASSTSNGSSGPLVISASTATSTYNAQTAPLRVVVTQNSGTIDPSFLPSSVLNTGKTAQLITTIGTSSWAVPSGVKNVGITVVGAGATGGSCKGDSTHIQAQGGGGAGGLSFGFFDVSATTSIQVFVAATSTATTTPAQWTTFGTNGFYEFATGGAPGTSMTDATMDNATFGGAGGRGSGGTLNISGRNGSGGDFFRPTGGDLVVEGNGGDSPLGFGYGGRSQLGEADPAGSDPSVNASGYGGGGVGSTCLSGSTSLKVGSNATKGVILITY